MYVSEPFSVTWCVVRRRCENAVFRRAIHRQQTYVQFQRKIVVGTARARKMVPLLNDAGNSYFPSSSVTAMTRGGIIGITKGRAFDSSGTNHTLARATGSPILALPDNDSTAHNPAARRTNHYRVQFGWRIPAAGGRHHSRTKARKTSFRQPGGSFGGTLRYLRGAVYRRVTTALTPTEATRQMQAPGPVVFWRVAGPVTLPPTDCIDVLGGLARTYHSAPRGTKMLNRPFSSVVTHREIG